MGPLPSSPSSGSFAPASRSHCRCNLLSDSSAVCGVSALPLLTGFLIALNSAARATCSMRKLRAAAKTSKMNPSSLTPGTLPSMVGICFLATCQFGDAFMKSCAGPHRKSSEYACRQMFAAPYFRPPAASVSFARSSPISEY